MTTSTPPALSARDISAAARATRALLDRLLDEVDLPFDEWTVLFVLDGTGPLGRRELVERQVAGLRVAEATARATVDVMLAAGLIAEAEAGAGAEVADGGAGRAADPCLAPTVAGTAVYRPIRAAVDDITDRIYGDLPPDDVAATRRTLDEVTRRANVLLAG
jgi:hypothetical protein